MSNEVTIKEKTQRLLKDAYTEVMIAGERKMLAENSLNSMIMAIADTLGLNVEDYNLDKDFSRFLKKEEEATPLKKVN